MLHLHRTTHAPPPDLEPGFACTSPFAAIALVQLSDGVLLGDRLQRCLAQLIAHRKAR